MEEIIMSEEEMINHPQHYQGNKFEVIDIIEDYDLGFNLGNAVKYILRCEKKGNKKQDLEKAIWYIQREIKNNENKCPVCGKRLENENMQVCKECEKDIRWGASISEYAEKNKNCCIKKCFSCGKEFRTNNVRDLICPKCYDKYVGD
jgi:hypothetical protein